MKYIIDEEELIQFVDWLHNDMCSEPIKEDYVKDFLKSKQPVELVASGEVPYSNIGIHKYYPTINNFTGKQVEIYIKEIK